MHDPIKRRRRRGLTKHEADSVAEAKRTGEWNGVGVRTLRRYLEHSGVEVKDEREALIASASGTDAEPQTEPLEVQAKRMLDKGKTCPEIAKALGVTIGEAFKLVRGD